MPSKAARERRRLRRCRRTAAARRRRSGDTFRRSRDTLRLRRPARARGRPARGLRLPLRRQRADRDAGHRRRAERGGFFLRGEDRAAGEDVRNQLTDERPASTRRKAESSRRLQGARARRHRPTPPRKRRLRTMRGRCRPWCAPNRVRRRRRAIPQASTARVRRSETAGRSSPFAPAGDCVASETACSKRRRPGISLANSSWIRLRPRRPNSSDRPR